MAAVVNDVRYLEHLTGIGHPESPERCAFITKKLQEAGLLSKKNLIAPRKASKEEVLYCHTPSYYELVKTEVESGRPMLSTGDAEISQKSFEIAHLSAGGALAAVDAVLEGTKSVFCNVRPPGHHACSNRGMGFCIFNNAAIAARYAQRKRGLKKVAILDWDLHHGNGTQEIFYNDPSVFYFSTHELGNYPGTGDVYDRGAGNIMNYPILAEEGAREEILAAFDHPLKEALDAFRPDLVIISAGFDSHEADPLGHLNLKTEDFRTLTELVIEASGSAAGIVSVLEGGYDIQALGESVCAHVEALSGIRDY